MAVSVGCALYTSDAKARCAAAGSHAHNDAGEVGEGGDAWRQLQRPGTAKEDRHTTQQGKAGRGGEGAIAVQSMQMTGFESTHCGPLAENAGR